MQEIHRALATVLRTRHYTQGKFGESHFGGLTGLKQEVRWPC